MVKINNCKRQTRRLRAKIDKKVREYNIKQKSDAKSKKHIEFHKKRKNLGVPNSLPLKEIIPKEAEDSKKLLVVERQRMDEARKKERQKLLSEKRSLDGLIQDARTRASDFERKQASQNFSSYHNQGKNVETSRKTFYKEFRKVVDAADVVLEILDARDPLGSRCPELEESVLNSGHKKRLVLVVNKIDLVPKENVEAWLKYLKNEFPVIAFKASVQTQNEHLGQKKLSFAQANPDFIKSSSSLGAETLMKLLGNYCRSIDIKTTIRVGVVGLPNTGKSSIINSLKRSKACNVGALPGITKQMQEVHLDKHIRLLDSPGVVMATNLSDTSLILRNCVKLENVNDVMSPVEAILKRCNKLQMMLHYSIPEYKDVNEFLSLLAHRLGKLKKGGLPDIGKAARSVLQDWNMGKIGFYTHPPEQQNTHLSAEIVYEMGKEFDIDNLLLEQQKEIDATLQRENTKHMLVESFGPLKVVMKAEDIDMAEDEIAVENDSDFDIEDNESDGDNMQFNDDNANDCSEMKEVTVSLPSSLLLPTNATTITGRQVNASKTSSSKKLKMLQHGLPQSNKAKKMEFKKMKKQRRRRDRVAGDLSSALESAFNFGVE